MIGYLSCIIAFVLCIFVYIKMVKRDESATLGKKSIIPVIFGLFTPFVTLVLIILSRVAIISIAGQSFSITVPNLMAKSLLKAFLGAGFTEEFVKLLFALLCVAIVKPKNVYTYALMFVGVGFGFTALEEFVYGGGNDLFSLARLPGFALHMVFGIIMGTHLGLARYNKKTGNGGSAMHICGGLILPVLWHTVYDAATVDNAGLALENEAAIIIALVVEIASIVLQFIMLSKFKKQSKDYCQMSFE